MKKQNIMSSVSLTDIRRKLRKGEMANIANVTGYSYSHVWHVINGDRGNRDGSIIKEAHRITRRRK